MIKILKQLEVIALLLKGGPGSGNFGHEGRPGERGGSGEGGGGKGAAEGSKSYSDDEIDDWSADIAQEKGSAFDVWMDKDQKRELKNLADKGYKIRAKAFSIAEEDGETYDDVLTDLKDKMSRAGYKLFADESNFDQGDAVFIKKPGK